MAGRPPCAVPAPPFLASTLPGIWRPTASGPAQFSRIGDVEPFGLLTTTQFLPMAMPQGHVVAFCGEANIESVEIVNAPSPNFSLRAHGAGGVHSPAASAMGAGERGSRHSGKTFQHHEYFASDLDFGRMKQKRSRRPKKASFRRWC